MRLIAIEFAHEQIEQRDHKREEMRIGDVVGVATFVECSHESDRGRRCDEAIGRRIVVRIDIGDKFPSGQGADHQEKEEEREFATQGTAYEGGHIENTGQGAEREIFHVCCCRLDQLGEKGEST